MAPSAPKRQAPAPRPRRRWAVPPKAPFGVATWGRSRSVGEVVRAITKTSVAVIDDDKARVKENGCQSFPLLLLRSAYLARALSGGKSAQLENVEAASGHLNIDRRDLMTFRLLGSGRTASVYEGSWSGRPVAVKRMEAGELSADTPIVRELAILSRLEHPNLVRLMGCCCQGSTFEVVLELCGGGSLFDLLHNSDYWVTMQQQLKIAEDVARGMEYLHGSAPPIMHRDLKSLNVMMLSTVSCEQHVPFAKVADFGTAKACPSGQRRRWNSQGVGTVQWMSPELLSGGADYATEVDVYAYGALLCEIMSFEPPFWDVPPSEVERVVLEGGRPELDASVPGVVAELIEECWAQDPRSRPTFVEVVEDLVTFRKSSRNGLRRSS